MKTGYSMKVVEFTKGAPPAPEPNESLVALLEDLLEIVREGRIISLVAVYGFPDGDTNSMFALDPRVAPERIIGELYCMAGDMVHCVNCDNYDSLTNQPHED